MKAVLLSAALLLLGGLGLGAWVALVTRSGGRRP